MPRLGSQRAMRWFVRLIHRTKDDFVSLFRHHWRALNKPLVFLLGGMILLLTLYMYLVLIIAEKYGERQQLLTALQSMADASRRNNEQTIDQHKRYSQHIKENTPGWSQDAKEQSPGCKPKQNFAFIKVHKSGSTTVQSIFLRYGYSHNLTVMLPGQKNPASFSWPDFPSPGDAYPVSGGVYNVLTHHARYHPDTIRERMRPDTVCLAIMRHPLDHLRSMFNFIHLHLTYLKRNMDPTNPLQAFLENVNKYAAVDSKLYDGGSATRNFQAYVLGFDQMKDFSDEEIKEQFKERIRDVPFVLILEHLDESLVVLKRLMCWTLTDIIYDWTARNYRKFYFKSSSLSPQAMETHRKWSSIDYALYEHYNGTLWEEVRRGGEDFVKELEHFRTINSNVNEQCRINPTGRKSFPATKWNMAWEINGEFCRQLRRERYLWDWKLSMRQNENIRRERLIS